ncbi:hypothetical protein M9194_21135 [Vibrio sp. S4M6]|uniref:toxin-antitoxin system YwqK family antitoxin n=1 Tax=Vibrio sinus TaxID=2946865 RepID=UPI002029EEDF|nr:hypothetical protein [Vibrio sinus]MCL9783928.1 hypothetical protein [Vibrio sinus]
MTKKLRVDENLFDYDDDLVVFDGEWFTGVGYLLFENGNGQVEYETLYKNGLPHGYEKHWYPNGKLSYDQSVKNGAPHGTSRFWYENGQLKKERIAEYGIVLKETDYHIDGSVEGVYDINEDPNSYELLLSFRESRKNDGKEW